MIYAAAFGWLHRRRTGADRQRRRRVWPRAAAGGSDACEGAVARDPIIAEAVARFGDDLTIAFVAERSPALTLPRKSSVAHMEERLERRDKPAWR
jgi:hypothetical protein